MKTHFGSEYEKNLMEEKRRLVKQIEIRKDVEVKWDKVRISLDPNEYHDTSIRVMISSWNLLKSAFRPRRPTTKCGLLSWAERS
jgi:hypothetical protein